MLSKSRYSSTSVDERINAMQEQGRSVTLDKSEFDNITQLATLICNTPIAVITMVDGDQLLFMSIKGVIAQHIQLKDSFSWFTLQGDDVFEVPDISEDVRFKDHPGVIGSPHARFYAGAPLIDHQGHKLGAIGVFDVVPRLLTDEQKEGLKTLSREIITHITLKEKSEELAIKTQRFEDILNMSTVSPEIHCILDNEGNILFINDAVATTLEYTADEVKGLKIWGFCNKDDINRVVKSIEDGLRVGQKQFNVECRIVTKTGLVRWVSWNTVAKNARWYAYGRDITDSKRIEDDLMKLSFVASKIDSGVVISDSKSHVTWLNSAFEKITGFTLEDLKGQRLGDLIAGPDTDLELLEQARQLSRQHQSFTVDLLAYRKDRKPIWLSIHNTVVLNEMGGLEMEVEIIIDISDKKKVEQELQVLSLVASKTNTSVNISNRQGHTTWVNQSLEKLTGYTLSELKGKKLGDILSKDSSEQAIIEASRSKTQNNESYAIEVKAATKDGGHVWLSVSNTPIINEKGELERQIDLITDITQRKQVEQELINSKEQALRLSEAKEMFLSVMSHEIRTPLNAVIGMTHLLIDNDPKPSQIDDLNILKFSADNLLNIINDILDFTKIETGSMSLESVPFSVKALTSDIITSLQVNASIKDNRLNLTLDSRLPDNIVGDRTRLYQILINLLGNAIKFTDHGTITLKVELAQGSHEEFIPIHFEVSDTGIGIPQDKQSYIFEAFTQAKTDISRKYGGTGLGLAITKKLLNLYKSDIKVQSEEGKGTTFSFVIKFSKTSATDVVKSVNQTVDLFMGKRILVVDDNDINTLIAGRVLGKWGFLLDFAASGQEAIDKVMKNTYDLIFMDIKMPGMDGFEAATIIRQSKGHYYKSVPIIALTASNLQDEDAKFKASGMNGHILKPFKPEEIKNIITIYFS